MNETYVLFIFDSFEASFFPMKCYSEWVSKGIDFFDGVVIMLYWMCICIK